MMHKTRKDHQSISRNNDKARLSARLNTEFVRFLLVGAFNTLLGYVIYALFLVFIAYQLAFTMAYVVGIFSSYYLNSRFAFRTPLSLRKALQYPVVYVVQYLLGVVLITFWVDVVGIPEILGLPFVIVFTIPVTFTLSRFILKQQHTSTGPETMP